MKPERQDTELPFWTVDQAARHFGFRRATIEKYIRAGLPSYFGGRMVKPAEVIQERLARTARERAGELRRHERPESEAGAPI